MHDSDSMVILLIIKKFRCEKEECEEKVKVRSGEDSKAADDDEALGLTGQAKTLCIPFEQPELKEDDKCFHCGDKAKVFCIWGRSY